MSSGGTDDTKSSDGITKRRREEDPEDTNVVDTSIPNRWKKLWVPDYEEGAIDFDDDDHYKIAIISESDVEKDVNVSGMF